MCHPPAVVRSGRVVEQGKHSDLVKVPGGFYASLVARQALGEEERGEEGDAAAEVRGRTGGGGRLRRPRGRGLTHACGGSELHGH
jgi:hypothetical protein